MYLGCSATVVECFSHFTFVFLVARRLLRQHCFCRVRFSLVLLCFLPFYRRSHILCLQLVLVDKRLQRLIQCFPLRFMHLPSSSFTLFLGLGLRFRLLLTCPLFAHSVESISFLCLDLHFNSVPEFLTHVLSTIFGPLPVCFSTLFSTILGFCLLGCFGITLGHCS